MRQCVDSFPPSPRAGSHVQCPFTHMVPAVGDHSRAPVSPPADAMIVSYFGTMGRIALSIGLTFVIMNVGAFIAYGTFSALVGLQPPANGSPAQFVLSVFVVKLGLAVGFVLLFHVARETWAGRWTHYALIWWVMFAVTEVGQAIGPNYSWLEAVAGIIAEAIYCPLAALAAVRVLNPRGPARALA